MADVQAAKDNQKRLAALRAWTHFDGFAKSSFLGVSDTLLYNLLWKDWGEHGSNETSTNVSAAVSELADDSDGSDMAHLSDAIGEDGAAVADVVIGSDDEESADTVLHDGSDGGFGEIEPRPKEAKNRLDLLFLSDEEFDGPLRQALAKQKKAKTKNKPKLQEADDEETSTGLSNDDGDDPDTGVGSKRKSKPGVSSKTTRSVTTSRTRSAAHSRSASDPRNSPSAPRSRSNSAVPAKKRKVDRKGQGKAEARVQSADTLRKYNLGDLSQSGQGGRIMFVFEKKSDGTVL